ncbi:MAG TPA: gliding motility lipoprotein GldH [Ferruginibacter sp.]|nr:gliding motility lipoprotein GldH [Chitinophagales bacterium]TXH25795.1 MAG: gliding motility lipoprotein GldH [Cyclobacteriaceae bacterium]HMU72736.1 gliding motility lipoprotein GldH [Ferruginibacter sp.]HMW25046.1 gliding motility lipoprotein GldH [Ferruginibacter sp.]HMX35694.1 gliding motility lipoprotein GldH [Ferruginibacter sp.]
MSKNTMIRLYLLIPATCLLLASCKQVDLFEKNTVIPGNAWKRSYQATGQFVISDTVSRYSIYLVLRHTDAYNYNNIWLRVGLGAPGDSLFTQRVDLKLGDDANGWEGTGMNDIWEVRKLLNGEPRRFKKAGTYRFTISQEMRDDPLTGIMSAGMRLEKREP